MVRAFAPITATTGAEVKLAGGDGPGSYTVALETVPSDDLLTAAMRDGVGRVGDALGAGDAAIETYPLGASYHEAGGLRMASIAGGGVVDAFGRCWGDPRVRVMDAAAWPTIGCANPHLTIVALARRQAQALAADLEIGP
jgi:choline dehydrogenase-like flavoprotein